MPDADEQGVNTIDTMSTTEIAELATSAHCTMLKATIMFLQIFHQCNNKIYSSLSHIVSKTCTDSTFANDSSFLQIYSHFGSGALAVNFCQQKRKYPLSADGDNDDYHDGDDEDEGVMHSLLRVSRLKEDK